jgi:gas vesicle protein
MSHHDEGPYIIIEQDGGGGGAMPFIWGALLGAGVALLLAPRSGRETQEELKKSLDRVRRAAEERVEDARETVLETVERTRDRFTEQVDTVRDAVQERVDRAGKAVDAGRQAAQGARQELERRVAEAKAAAGGKTAGAPEAELEVTVTEVVIEEEDPRSDALG